MSRIFADTSFYVALLNTHDEFHAQARACSLSYVNEVVTTDYILVELGNWLSRMVTRNRFGAFFHFLRSDAKTTIVHVEPYQLERAVELYSRRQDKEWSLTDCVSFTIMKQLELDQALTTDHHFMQAGYAALLLQ